MCSCPSILICDDDNFQLLFYSNFFSKLIQSSPLSTEENFKIELFDSGEKLLDKYQKVHLCGCEKVLLVISDFHMGEKCMNGISTIAELRGKGYSKTIMMRTAETLDSLSKSSMEAPQLIEEHDINLLNKSDLAKFKELVQYFLEK